jgi:PleD family two-component response regulator
MTKRLENTTSIVFADDDAAMRLLVASVLRSAGHDVRLAENGAQALGEVHHEPPDLIVLDYRMGPPDGFQVCRELKADPRFAHLPVLILTGEGQLEERLTGFDAGADDYLAKPFDTRELLARVSAMLRLAHRGLERNPTSKLPGGEAISREFERRRLSEEPFCICYLDLDQFKSFNDRFGFDVADAAIRETGEVLRAISRGSEAFVGHVGGDDFVMLCRPGAARALVEEAQIRLRARLTRHLPREVAYRGFYYGTDRAGVVRKLPVTRLSAAIVRIDPRRVPSLSMIGETVAEVKRRAKRPGGSGIEEAELVG